MERIGQMHRLLFLFSVFFCGTSFCLCSAAIPFFQLLFFGGSLSNPLFRCKGNRDSMNTCTDMQVVQHHLQKGRHAKNLRFAKKPNHKETQHLSEDLWISHISHTFLPDSKLLLLKKMAGPDADVVLLGGGLLRHCLRVGAAGGGKTTTFDGNVNELNGPFSIAMVVYRKVRCSGM